MSRTVDRRILPLYVVVFVGFLGYSLMIATFTPMILRNDNGMLPAGSSLTERSLVLGLLLALYPLGQFLGSPVLGALSDHYGRRPILIGSLSTTTILYVGHRKRIGRAEPPPSDGGMLPGRTLGIERRAGPERNCGHRLPS